MLILVAIALGIALFMFPLLRCALLHPVKLLYYGVVDAYYYFMRKSWRNADYGQIQCYVADNSTSFGCGKTLSATDYLVSLYRRYDGVTVWCDRRKMFVVQKVKIISNVEFLTVPYERLISLVQFVQWTDKVQAWDDDHETLTVTYMLIDEASSQLNSRSFKGNFDPYFISRLLTSRHVHASIVLTSQRFSMVDKMMRDCTHLVFGCNKIWRFQVLNFYDAYEMENAQSPSMVAPLRRSCWFVSNASYANYDTYASVQSLRKSCEDGDMLSEAEILALQCSQPVNMDAVEKPSRRWLKTKKKQNK